MKTTQSPNVLALQNVVFPALRLQVNGLRRFARVRGWRLECVRLEPEASAARINEVIDECRPDGIIASLDRTLPDAVVGRIPTVCFDCAPALVPTDTPYINHDAKATAHLAARELFKAGCSSYAFMRAAGDWYWSVDREAAFVNEVRFRGGRLEESFCPPAAAEGRDKIGGGELFEQALRKWVEKLEKPCGVFAANDALAATLLKVCRKLGVGVPKDVAVVGVDNDFQICLKTKPRLTSVVPDWEMGAFLAGETLDMVMRGVSVPRAREFRPFGIIARESTQRYRMRIDFRVDLALGLIRRKACAGLRAADVACKMGCSRRLAEMRFREITGTSMQEAIRDARLQNARSMLEHTALPVSVVAKRSGWKSIPTFGRDFYAAMGVSPTECRKMFCAK